MLVISRWILGRVGGKTGGERASKWVCFCCVLGNFLGSFRAGNYDVEAVCLLLYFWVILGLFCRWRRAEMVVGSGRDLVAWSLIFRWG